MSKTIIFGGDVYLGGFWEEKIIQNQGDIFCNEINSFLADSDINIFNLESPLTNNHKNISKIGPCLKARPESVIALKKLNANVVNLANNHIMDFGIKGLNDTIRILDENSIEFTGVGSHKNNASNKMYSNNNISIINYCHCEFGVADEESGGYNGYDIIDIVQKIKYLKKSNQFVILVIHKGHEYFEYPSPTTKKEFRHFIDEGADLIVSHHSHFVSGYEIYKNKHIFYGIGNFIFDGDGKHKKWYQGVLLKIKIYKNAIEDFSILPTTQSKKIGVIEKGPDKFLNQIAKYNSIIKNDNELNQEWRKFINRIRNSYVIKLTNKSKYRLALIKRIPILEKLLIPSIKNNLILRNHINCQTHLEVVKEIIN